jgi:hypothetical protein
VEWEWSERWKTEKNTHAIHQAIRRNVCFTGWKILFNFHNNCEMKSILTAFQNLKIQNESNTLKSLEYRSNFHSFSHSGLLRLMCLLCASA